MRMTRNLPTLAACAFLATAWAADTPQGDLPQRQELKRAALATSPDMEVITSISEIRKGETMTLPPNRDPRSLPTRGDGVR